MIGFDLVDHDMAYDMEQALFHRVHGLAGCDAGAVRDAEDVRAETRRCLE